MDVLEIIEQILEDIDRTPAWLCRQAGVHRCNYTLIKKGERKLTENMKERFSKVLGIRKEILFNNEPKKEQSK
tara:strand:- start:1352 stop:1570 length:219 start_codon:yes stop_codon:yes gene_type:complete